MDPGRRPRVVPFALAAIGLGALVVAPGDAARAAPAAAPASTASTAAPGPPLDAWLGRAPGLVLRVDPRTLDQLGVHLRAIGGVAGGALALAAFASGGWLGFDATTRTGFERAGFDPDAPIWAELLAVDARDTDAAYQALRRTGGEWGTHTDATPPLWRARLVAHAGDPARLRATLLALPRYSAVLAVDGDAAALGRLLGGREGDGKRAGRVLAAAHVVAVAQIAEWGALVFIRQHGDVFVLDLVTPFGGNALEWARDRHAILALIGEVPGRTARGPRPLPASAVLDDGVALWASAAALVDLSQAWRATELLHLRSAGVLGDLPDLARLCGGLRGIARGAIGDLGVALVAEPHALRMRAAAGISARLGRALAVRDDRVLGSAPAGVLSAALRLASLAGLRALPRPALYGAWDDLWDATELCAAGARPLVELFGWPELAGLWLGELAATDRDVAAVLDGVGNLGLAVRRAARDRHGVVGAAEVSLGATAARLADHGLTRIFGARRTLAARGVAPARIEHGQGRPARTYIIDVAGHSRVGVAWSKGSEPWRFALPLPAAGQTPLLELDAVAGQLLPSLTRGTAWAALGKAVAARLGSLHAEGAVTGGRLELSATLELP